MTIQDLEDIFAKQGSRFQNEGNSALEIISKMAGASWMTGESLFDFIKQQQKEIEALQLSVMKLESRVMKLENNP